MRTTLINTTFWKEDTIDELHLDSKLLYLYMITNPDKGLANIYHYKKKVISAYSGLSVEQIDVAAKQLVQLGYIDIFKGYFMLLKGHEMAKKGRFTDKTIEKEKQAIDPEVLAHFNLLNHDNSSGVAPEHKDKDNNKDKSINKEISIISKKYYQVISKYKLPVRNHNNVKLKIKELEKVDDAEKYLDFLLEWDYNTIIMDFKPTISEALDIYAKRLQITNLIKQAQSKKPTFVEV